MGGLRAPPGWARYGDCSALSSCVLSLLPRERRVDLIPNLYRLRFGAGEVIFRQGVPVAGLYILCRGYAKLEFRTSSEKKLLVKFCAPGDLLEGGALRGARSVSGGVGCRRGHPFPQRVGPGAP